MRKNAHVPEQSGTGLGPSAGDNRESEFEQLYEEYRTRVFSTAYRLVGNRADADDITQDVFLKVYKNLETFRGDAAVSTWIYRIAVNTCFDFLRRRKRQATVPLDETNEPSVSSQMFKRLIETMVLKLPDAYRKVFTLYDIQGLKHAEIAETLGITEGTSKSLLHRARAKMREMLAPYVKDRYNR